MRLNKTHFPARALRKYDENEFIKESQVAIGVDVIAERCKFAPIILFAFNRPNHLRKTLVALSNNILADKSDLIIYCDGPRHERDVASVNEVLSVANSMTRFRSCKIIKRNSNFGLAKNIISGVSEQLISYDRVIVLEDDLVTSPFFLKYMNEGLEVYSNDSSVASIHGYRFPCNKKPLQDTFFLKGADCWGWGTWRRSWKFFNPNARYLYDKILQVNGYVDFNRKFSFGYMEMLQDVYQGNATSWAIRWLASAWINEMYTLYPRESLVRNIGMDGSGVHCSASNIADVCLSEHPIPVERIPVEEDKNMVRELMRFLEKDSGGKLERAKRFLNYYLPFLRANYNFLKKFFKFV